MPNNTHDPMETIIKRMDLIIRLMLKKQQSQSDNKITQKDQILELYNFGISTQDIADILGTTRNNVDVALTGLRKVGKIPTNPKSVAKTESKPASNNVEAQQSESIVGKTE